MKIMVFLHGNIIMHRTATGKSRKQRAKQVVENCLEMGYSLGREQGGIWVV